MHKPTRIYCLDDVVYFKKHQGKTVRQVIEQDPGFAEWMDSKHALMNCNIKLDGFARIYLQQKKAG